MTRTKVGIFGGGQLGRMLALSGAELGLKIELFSNETSPCGAEVAAHREGSYEDEKAVAAFVKSQDVVTAEFENIPLSTLSWAGNKLAPGVEAFRVAQDRLNEKNLAARLGIPVPKFAEVSDLESLRSGYESLQSTRAVLKTRSLGYDGKGQARIGSALELDSAWKSINAQPALLEEFFPFEREVSIIAVRSTSGEEKFYDLVENTHENGILVRSVVTPGAELSGKARSYAERILRELHYVGVLAIEFFVKDGELFLNEMAPRVHNSGHWTIEGAATSQFENHLRAILGLPLGETQTIGSRVELENIIGTLPQIDNLLREKNLHLHLYGKSERPGRKIGHITRVRYESAS